MAKRQNWTRQVYEYMSAHRELSAGEIRSYFIGLGLVDPFLKNRMYETRKKLGLAGRAVKSQKIKEQLKDYISCNRHLSAREVINYFIGLGMKEFTIAKWIVGIRRELGVKTRHPKANQRKQEPSQEQRERREKQKQERVRQKQERRVKQKQEQRERREKQKQERVRQKQERVRQKQEKREQEAGLRIVPGSAGLFTPNFAIFIHPTKLSRDKARLAEIARLEAEREGL